MKTFNVMLTSINDVKGFVSAAGMQSCEIDVVSGRYTIDAKSIMGLFSLDLSKPITIEVHGTDEQAAEFCEACGKYIVEGEKS